MVALAATLLATPPAAACPELPVPPATDNAFGELTASARAFPHDFALLNPLLATPPRSRRTLQRRVTALAQRLDEAGVYIAVGAAPGDDGYQCGFDDAPLCAHQSGFVDRFVAAAVDPELRPVVRLLFACEGVIRDPAGPLGACRAANAWTYRAESAFTDATAYLYAAAMVAFGSR